MATTNTLNIYESIVAFSDTQISSNPQRQIANYSRKYTNLAVTNAKNEQFTITPGSSLSVFSGVRSTTLDGTTAFTTSQNIVIPNTYRFTWTGGTNPTLRTDRNLTLSSVPITVTINNNVQSTFSIPSGGSTFSGTVVGDNIWIPGPTTGDGLTPFNVLNQGLWVVISVASNNLSVTAVRPAGTLFQAAPETQTPTSNSQFDVFSSAGVQIGDMVDISMGFSSVDFGSYVVSNVTSTFFEIQSALPIAIESGIIPTVTGLVFYNLAKRFLRVEVDQNAAVQVNGNSTQNTRVYPLVPADPNNVGFYEQWGIVWSLTVVNRSTVNILNLSVISCE
jgi:hypothetical protein